MIKTDTKSIIMQKQIFIDRKTIVHVCNRENMICLTERNGDNIKAGDWFLNGQRLEQCYKVLNNYEIAYDYRDNRYQQTDTLVLRKVVASSVKIYGVPLLPIKSRSEAFADYFFDKYEPVGERDNMKTAYKAGFLQNGGYSELQLLEAVKLALRMKDEKWFTPDKIVQSFVSTANRVQEIEIEWELTDCKIANQGERSQCDCGIPNGCDAHGIYKPKLMPVSHLADAGRSQGITEPELDTDGALIVKSIKY